MKDEVSKLIKSTGMNQLFNAASITSNSITSNVRGKVEVHPWYKRSNIAYLGLHSKERPEVKINFCKSSGLIK